MTVVRGLLGWSNKRTGLEFYRWDPKIIPRHGSEWGDLLALEPEIAGSSPTSSLHEGCTVLVVICPREWAEAEIKAVETAIEEAVG